MNLNKRTTFPCFVCNKAIKKVHPEVKIDSITLGMWEGSSIEISGCYGSQKFDGTTFHGLICDECLEKYRNRLCKLLSITQVRTKYNYEK